jgi:Hpt domain
MSSGLIYSRKDPVAYWRLLLRFRDGPGGTFMDEFAAWQAAGDRPSAARLLHTIKGLARQVGAKALGEWANGPGRPKQQS